MSWWDEFFDEEYVFLYSRALTAARTEQGAICLFNSLGCGTDHDTLAMLRERRRVAPALVVETAHRDEHVRRARPGVGREWMDVDGRRVHAERTLDPVAGVARAVFSFERKVRELRHRLCTATELVALLRAAGFAQVDCCGSYEPAPFSIDAPLLRAHAKAA